MGNRTNYGTGRMTVDNRQKNERSRSGNPYSSHVKAGKHAGTVYNFKRKSRIRKSLTRLPILLEFIHKYIFLNFVSFYNGLNSNINNRVSGVLLVNKADKKLLKLKDTNEKKYVTASGNVYSNMISKLPCVLDELSNGCVFRRIRKIFSYVFVDEIQDFVGYDLEVIKKLHEVGCNMTLVGDPRQTTYRTHYEAKYKKYAGGKIVIFVQDNIAGMNIDTTTLSTSYRNNQIICDLANQMYPDMKPCDSAMNEKTGHDGIFWVHENDIDEYVDIYNPVQLRYDKRTKVNPIPKTMNFGLSKGLTFNRVLIYSTKPMLDWLSGKSKDMKDESLSKFYVAVTRARYSVAFVYKTKRLPTNDIGTKWTPDVL